MKTRYFKKQEKTWFMDFCFDTLNRFLSSQIIFLVNKIDRSWRDLSKNMLRLFFRLLWPSSISILQNNRFHCISNIFWNIYFSSISLFFHDFCYFFCNNLLFSWLFRNLGNYFATLDFVRASGALPYIKIRGQRNKPYDVDCTYGECFSGEG